MSQDPQTQSSHRFTSAFVSDCRNTSPNVWSDAGHAIESAHLTRAPAGLAPWVAVVLLLIAIASYYV